MLELESVRLARPLPALLWSAADTDPEQPLPLLVVHDGPEYAEYSPLVRLLDHPVAFGEVPECRAALLPPPVDRNETYSASARYAHALAAEVVPARARAGADGPAAGADGREPRRAGGAARALPQARAFGGLFLQSCSFFRRRLDKHESGFGRFGRITRFVGHVHGAGDRAARPGDDHVRHRRGEPRQQPRGRRGARRRGWDVRTFWHRDAHNWVSWRDALDPHLAELLLRAWT